MSWSERLLVARASLLLPLVAASLRLSGFQKTYRRLEGSPGNRTAGDTQQTSEFVAVAARNLPLFRPTCLTRSLVLWHVLHRHGAPAELRIGVRRTGDHFAAHAWVEQDGQVINDAPDIARLYTPVDLSAALDKRS